MRRSVRTPFAALLLLLAACSGGEPAAPEPDPKPASEPGPESAQASEPLSWRPTGFDPADRVVIGENWHVMIEGSAANFEKPDDPSAAFRFSETDGGEIDQLLLDGDTAIVSYAFGGETTSGLGYRVDLTTGEGIEIVSPEPANGGEWALIDDSLYYPALGEGGVACLATLAVADGNGEDGWCPEGRVGIAGVDANEDGVSLMLFDYGSDISCRTLTRLDTSGVPTPIEGPTECIGWDVAATGTGSIWSQVPRPRRQESAVFFASVDDVVRRLGRGTTGSLISCGGDYFYVSDPVKRTDPARLMRWDGTSLSTAYTSESKGNAFLGTPECADGIITLTAFGEDGDEQVSAIGG